MRTKVYTHLNILLQ